MTIDSFNKDTNKMNMSIDKLSGQKPIDLVCRTNPILILDKPQNMEDEKAKQAISNLKPLFTLRYSATHKNYYNLVYRLTPVDAYNKSLVKKIEVSSVVNEDDFNSAYIKCLEIKAEAKGIKAKLKLNKKLKSSFKVIETIVKTGDNLADKTALSEYDGFIVSEINAKYNFVKFSNGVSIDTGEEVGGDRLALAKVQIEQTVEEHFRKHRILKQYGIKVLSLFFIDRVDNYLQENGVIKKYFTDAFNTIKNRFDEFREVDVNSVHTGYLYED
jgi:type III restriction enzyme